MRLRSVGLVIPLALGLLASPLPAQAKQSGKIPRVGVVFPISPLKKFLGPIPDHPHMRALLAGLSDLGYVDGETILIERRSAEGNWGRLPEIFAELVRLQVDVIVTVSNRLVYAAKEATKSIPIVMATSGDPVGHGLVESLARPGGNITGIDLMTTTELAAKWFQLLKEVASETVRVAVLTRPKLSLGRAGFESAGKAAGVTPVVLEVESVAQLDAAFAAMTRDRPDALLVDNIAFYWPHCRRIADFAARNRLPSMGGWGVFPESGGLMAYGANLTSVFRRAAYYVDRILKGTKPADLPVERPMRFEFVINLKTAKALGLTIPESILIRADKVIE